MLLLAGLAFGVRLINPTWLVTDDGLFFTDPDTVRRLARLQHLEEAGGAYPSPDVRDGYPGGTVIHWTRPMDWVIRGLDAVAPDVHGASRPNENGAAWAGPVLGSLALLAFALLAWYGLGPWPGLLLSLIYALSKPLILSSQLGNGDHQNLQHLFVVVATLGLLAVLAGRGRLPLAVLAGAALGLSVWVTTESMAVLVVLGAAVGVYLWLADADARVAKLPLLLGWALACVGVCSAAHLVENPGARFWAFEWDRISWLQVVLALVPLMFLLALRVLDARTRLPRWSTPLAGGVAALLLVGLPFLLFPTLREALQGEWATLRASNLWARAAVLEYRPLLRPYLGGWTREMAVFSFTHGVFLVPVLLAGLFLHRGCPRSTRVALGLTALGYLGLALLEIKLVHLFSIVYPLTIVLGATGIAGRVRRDFGPTATPVDRAGAVTGVVFIVLFGLALPLARRDRAEDPWMQARVAVVRAIGRLAASAGGSSERRAVLADWDLGGHLMYYAGVPVVASGYHRNLGGIRDSYRFLATTSPDEAAKIVSDRRVRWIVWPGNPTGLVQLADAFPSLPRRITVTDGGSVRFDPELPRTVWMLFSGGPPPGSRLKEVHVSEEQGTWLGHFRGPYYRVYEVPE